jgi:hypothetical protein
MSPGYVPFSGIELCLQCFRRWPSLSWEKEMDRKEILTWSCKLVIIARQSNVSRLGEYIQRIHRVLCGTYIAKIVVTDYGRSKSVWEEETLVMNEVSHQFRWEPDVNYCWELSCVVWESYLQFPYMCTLFFLYNDSIIPLIQLTNEPEKGSLFP